MKIKHWLALTAVFLLAAACGGGSNNITTESGLQYEEIEEGTGAAPQPGDIVAVHYTGTLEDGTEFDSSYTRGTPFEFPLGQGAVIPGWDEGIALMKEGGTARLTVPPDLAYGEAGAGDVIPPNSTLIFDVELVSIQPPPPTPTPPPPPTAIDSSEFTTTDSGLQYFVLEEGSGDLPEDGGLVTIHFAGWLAEDLSSIGNSYIAGQPVPFRLGAGQIMEGWDEAVAQMRIGEKTQFIVPPSLGFGETGSPPVIPPNATLIFEIELVDALPAPPPPTSLEEDAYTTTESGLQIAVLEEGEGEETPQEGQIAVVHYRGWLEDGTEFDASYNRDAPFEFPVGLGAVIPGWDEGVATMNVGDVVQLVIPPDLGYGEFGSGSIPPDATLIFEVELLEIRDN